MFTESSPVRYPVGKGLPAATFRALRYRDFRLYWLALIISLLGASFQTLAQGWLVYRLTDSPFMLGVTGFVPALIAGPFWLVGGVIADRVPRRTLIIYTQSASMLPPLALAALIWVDQVQVWHVILSLAATALIAALDWPARMALIPQLVTEDDLGNAQALSSLAYQTVRIVGPALAGVVIAVTGEAACFAINGLSYGALVFALVAMKTRPQPAARRQTIGASLMEGYRYLLRTPVLIGLLGLMALQGLFLTSYVTLMPVFARDILAVGSTGLGMMASAVGVGAVVGALAVGHLGSGRRGRFLFFASLGMPLVLALFAWSRALVLSASLLSFMGLGTVALTTTTITLLLLIVPDELRGRLSSLASMMYLGAPLIGGLLITFLAEQRGSSIALNAAAGLFLVGAMVLFRRLPELQRVS